MKTENWHHDCESGATLLGRRWWYSPCSTVETTFASKLSHEPVNGNFGTPTMDVDMRYKICIAPLDPFVI